MQISENSIKHLTLWKLDIERDVQTDSNLWDGLYPLYSMICFWRNKKMKEDYMLQQELLKGGA